MRKTPFSRPHRAGHSHPAWYRVARVLAAPAALAVVGIAVAGWMRSGHGVAASASVRRPAGHEVTATAPAAPPGVAAPRLRRIPPGTLMRVGGTHLINGLYLTYPHTQAGAVSAAVEFIGELGSTLDPDRAATIARLTADASFGGAPQAAAAGVVSTRRHLGLPVTGPLPPGTAVSLVPAMYQVRDVTSARVTVLLLFGYTAIVPAGIQEHVGAVATTLRWTAASWRLLSRAGPGTSGLIATPGTAAAAAKGWKAMTDGV